MASSDPPSIRISLIANRYMIFDPEAAALLRRHQNVAGNLSGILHQQPTQNVFLGMPIEIRAEEAHSLVQRGAAHVVDDAAAHKAALRGGADRSKYVQRLRRHKTEMDRVAKEAHAENNARWASEKAKSKKSPKSKQDNPPAANTDQGDDSGLFEQSPAKPAAPSQESSPLDNWAITPTPSHDLLPPELDHDFDVSHAPNSGPLARHLQSSGFYMTPGLRFGCKYSVYPGDPLRFHAHFMANDYDWDETVPILDIVEGGRLATAVKKSFLIGGADQDEASPSGDGTVRTYSLEWAGM